MIMLFKYCETEKIFNTECSRNSLDDIQKWAFQNLAMLDAPERVDNLRIPPSNMLETLSEECKGQ